MNDTQRLDWLESQQGIEILTNSTIKEGLPIRLSWRSIYGDRIVRGSDLRDAIDKVMEGGEK